MSDVVNNTIPATQDDFELVTINLRYFKSLEADSKFLKALEYFGWPYYEEALERFEESL